MAEATSTSERGIRCPACGGPTRVNETREIERGLRRRRICRAGCGGRITTMEHEVPSHTKHDGQDMMFVKRQDLARLREVADALVGQLAVSWRRLARKGND